ncbi:MAG: hypothetical protein GDA49_02650 [Rhodospirillales bacterium]|nr:hypothetical protein [Rhodospirillales bacterium]
MLIDMRLLKRKAGEPAGGTYEALSRGSRRPGVRTVSASTSLRPGGCNIVAANATGDHVDIADRLARARARLLDTGLATASAEALSPARSRQPFLSLALFLEIADEPEAEPEHREDDRKNRKFLK